MTPAEHLVRVARSLHARGLTPGRTGNVSVRDGDQILLTPTGVSLGDADPDALSVLDGDGRHVGGPRPTKEWPLHLAMYGAAAGRGAVVHLHSTCAVAVSCLDGLDPADVLPPLTAYYVLRVGRLPLVPFHPPGHPALADAVRRPAARHPAVLLAHHGSVAAGADLDAAADAAEEVEECARLFLLLEGSGRPYHALAAADVDRLVPPADAVDGRR